MQSQYTMPFWVAVFAICETPAEPEVPREESSAVCGAAIPQPMDYFPLNKEHRTH